MREKLLKILNSDKTVGRKADEIISLIRPKQQRTLSQNALYWLYLNCIAENTGNDKDTLHEYFKGEFLKQTDVFIIGEQVREFNYIESTTALNTKQFTNYIEKIIKFAAEDLNITLPNPNDRGFAEFYAKYIELC